MVVPLSSTTVQVGAAASPLPVLKMRPSLCATQTTLALPGAIAIALMLTAGVTAGLIAVHATVAALALLVRHRLRPPTSSRVGSLGSRINGAMKFALLPASA